MPRDAREFGFRGRHYRVAEETFGGRASARYLDYDHGFIGQNLSNCILEIGGIYCMPILTQQSC